MTKNHPLAQQENLAQQDKSDRELKHSANRALMQYGLMRLLLFIVLTVVIQLAAYFIGAPVPLAITALMALLVAFPLSMLIFAEMRIRANEALAAVSERRRMRKKWIEEELAER
ncbi:DUF4229 domain-containing protein [Corynebacterium caspium]|uniref:DUF4229 domain-containing protein n=1 Tax=Corynebacterium caspium TaxID=234828 RepID=UPI00037E26F6|nr:DUF4229 domain-containing protein [Corynebacterium caspium]WKD59886.1 hypothetical protein CCASP_07555 [Corynebacterium caspium DSM 44850]